MLPNVRTFCAAVLATFVLVAGALALMAVRMPDTAASRTAAGADRRQLTLSVGGESAEFRSHAEVRRREELSRLLSIQIGPAGALARETKTMTIPAVNKPSMDAWPGRIVIAALPPPASTPARQPVDERPLLPPETVVFVPVSIVTPSPTLKLASLPAPELRPEPPGDEIETYVVSSDPPSMKEWNVAEPPADEPSSEPSVRLPSTVRLPAVRVQANPQRARSRLLRPGGAVQARKRAQRRSPARRSAGVNQPTAGGYQSQFDGWPTDAFLQPLAQGSRRPARGRARALQPQ
jgi:hypothetical protein